MQARMKNPILLIPDALKGVLAVDKSTANDDLPYVTRKLVHLRGARSMPAVSASTCTRTSSRRRARQTSVSSLFGLAEAPFFTDAERAALALTEAATRLSDRTDAVPDAIWVEAARHYDEKALAALVIQIALINFFNRINATTRQVAGEWKS